MLIHPGDAREVDDATDQGVEEVERYGPAGSTFQSPWSSRDRFVDPYGFSAPTGSSSDALSVGHATDDLGDPGGGFTVTEPIAEIAGGGGHRVEPCRVGKQLVEHRLDVVWLALGIGYEHRPPSVLEEVCVLGLVVARRAGQRNEDRRDAGGGQLSDRHRTCPTHDHVSRLVEKVHFVLERDHPVPESAAASRCGTACTTGTVRSARRHLFVVAPSRHVVDRHIRTGGPAPRETYGHAIDAKGPEGSAGEAHYSSPLGYAERFACTSAALGGPADGQDLRTERHARRNGVREASARARNDARVRYRAEDAVGETGLDVGVQQHQRDAQRRCGQAGWHARISAHPDNDPRSVADERHEGPRRSPGEAGNSEQVAAQVSGGARPYQAPSTEARQWETLASHHALLPAALRSDQLKTLRLDAAGDEGARDEDSEQGVAGSTAAGDGSEALPSRQASTARSLSLKSVQGVSPQVHDRTGVQEVVAMSDIAAAGRM